jgi:hypothetical protein
MFDKFNLASGILAVALFALAQAQGWSLFDDVANPGHGSSGSSRVYHK